MTKHLIVLFFCLLIGVGKVYSQKTQPAPKKIEIKLFQIEGSKQWGYDILMNDKVYIHQPHIPAVNSVKGFQTKSDAQKTAELMVSKINKNIMPPAVSIAELDSLGIVK